MRRFSVVGLLWGLMWSWPIVVWPITLKQPVVVPAKAPAQSSTQSPARSSDPFDQFFTAKNEPASLHYKASYTDAKGSHEVEVWRNGAQRLRRRTDDVLDLFVRRESNNDLQITVLDHRRRISTDVSRSALYRLGHHSDWFGLAHGLAKPVRPYTITRLPAALTTPLPPGDCTWYQLDIDTQRNAVCWSTRWHLPMFITDASGHVQWKIEFVESKAIPAQTFAVQDQGYIRVDARRDLEAD